MDADRSTTAAARLLRGGDARRGAVAAPGDGEDADGAQDVEAKTMAWTATSGASRNGDEERTERVRTAVRCRRWWGWGSAAPKRGLRGSADAHGRGESTKTEEGRRGSPAAAESSSDGGSTARQRQRNSAAWGRNRGRGEREMEEGPRGFKGEGAARRGRLLRVGDVGKVVGIVASYAVGGRRWP